MINPQQVKSTSIHLSKDTIIQLDAIKHLGQSYDGVIKELLLKIKQYETTGRE